jgi:DNA-binding GntR family transcriptional regulator
MDWPMSHSEVAAPQSVADDADRILSLWHDRAGKSATSDAVHATLHEAIILGLLPPGARLAEEELGALLGVSRTPIREALFRLEAEHLAVRIQRRGLEVRRITPAEILETYEVRQDLAALATRLAAPRITPADVARLRWLNDQLREAYATGDVRRSVALGDDIDDCLFRASGNSVLIHFLGQLRTRIRRFPGFTYQQRGRADDIIEEHDELIRALAEGDVERAVEVTNRHHLGAMQARIAMLASSSDEPLGETREHR